MKKIMFFQKTSLHPYSLVKINLLINRSIFIFLLYQLSVCLLEFNYAKFYLLDYEFLASFLEVYLPALETLYELPEFKTVKLFPCLAPASNISVFERYLQTTLLNTCMAQFQQL